MKKVASSQHFDYFEEMVETPYKRVRYVFLLSGGKEKFWFSERGFTTWQPYGEDLGLPFFELYLREGDVFVPPSWVKEAVFYQIFPERFYNGDHSNDPPGTRPWEDCSYLDWKTFFGGDLTGIREKLPYLEDLGITALYLTPIFKSPSTHKYDITNYFEIDPHFGDLTTFKELVVDCHKRGIKIILDGVFNHCGYDFPFFKDAREKGKDSKYVDWFNIYSFPVETRPVPSYETWGKNIWWMPRLRTENPETRDYLINVATYWIKEADIDGWRLDVAGELDREFLRVLRRAVKSAKSDAFVMGEVPHFASSYLQGDQLDSVMNYPLRYLILDFFVREDITPLEFDSYLSDLRMEYKREATEALYNLLGSHDTPRFLTLCKGQVEKMALSSMFLFTYPGVPAIYYGDEAGMSGGKDPECRKPMVWNKGERNIGLFELSKKLIALRKKYKSLIYGEFTPLLFPDADKVYAFLRRLPGEELLVVLNNSPRGEKVRIPIKSGKWELLLSVRSPLTFIEKEVFSPPDLTIPPFGGLIFKIGEN